VRGGGSTSSSSRCRCRQQPAAAAADTGRQACTLCQLAGGAAGRQAAVGRDSHVTPALKPDVASKHLAFPPGADRRSASRLLSWKLSWLPWRSHWDPPAPPPAAQLLVWHRLRRRLWQHRAPTAQRLCRCRMQARSAAAWQPASPALPAMCLWQLRRCRCRLAMHQQRPHSLRRLLQLAQPILWGRLLPCPHHS
jgi:hypothetical protein